MTPYEGPIKIRIIGADNCEKCKALVKLYKFQAMDFDFMDGNAKENEEFCDKWNVDKLPHVQAYHVASGEVLVNVVGFMTPADMLHRVQEAIENKIASRQVNLEGVAPSKTDKGCRSCNAKDQFEPGAERSS